MLFDMSDVFEGLTQPVIVIGVTKGSDQNFNPIITKKERPLEAVIQPADKNKLNPDVIDWSLSYFTVHSAAPFHNGEVLVYRGKYLKIIDMQDYSDYGYFTGTAEEIKDLGSIGL